MRMLLTSNGLANDTLRQAFAEMLGKPCAEARVAAIVTASLGQPGDHGWFVEALADLHGMGWGELDVLDLNGLPQDVLEGRLGRADVWWVTGGNQFHLAQSIARAGLSQAFPRLLRDKVYVGTSAGSMIFSRRFDERAADLLGDLADLHLLGEERIKPACPLFDWYVKPHLDSPSFPNRDEAWADRLAASVDFPLYLLDDDSAIRVCGDKVDVVSTGRWRLVGR
ncbi:Type 1 glutamine amidotransferase-like domain-containing protein [Plantactinospora sp. S1510]|uniref:Type 1 glutamine amidotransferase-like domain-containing protein n=2 Tax=Plantactinospora alkalitolerans TaxID=2789879 RepID=A0ABS0GPR0_9ACTN|nr:Type 1 glutamine amidotransferase-like domain-containing protein [Plantactinospora alkalitolerans]